MFKLLAWLTVLPPAAALLIYSLEVFAGFRRLREVGGGAPPCSAAILIPAHDEAATIGGTVRHLLRCREYRLLVVADNCSDATAQIARDAGASVIERSDPRNRGKGFALAFGRDHLALDPPDVVMILDADCRTNQQSIERLVSSAFALQAPVQACNLLIAPHRAGPIVQISNFAFLMKNLIRARGLYRLGGGIPLFGTGMAFPWTIFHKAPLASAETVEDLRLALDLADQGLAVHLVESARVTSAAATTQDTVAQRRRWEHGFIRITARHALPQLLKGAARLSRHQTALGLHLLVPPLALLLLVGAIASLLTLTIGLATQYWAPLWVILSALAVALAGTFLAWWNEGRGVLTVGALLRAPIYILYKIPIYLGLFNSRRDGWNRTPRNEDFD